MANFNILAGTTQTISSLPANSTNTVEGNLTAAYGAGGETLISTGPLPGECNVTVTGGEFDVDGISINDTITLNNATLNITHGNWNSTTTINSGTGSSGVRTAMPTQRKPWLEDRRCLGVYVKRITLRGGDDQPAPRHSSVAAGLIGDRARWCAALPLDCGRCLSVAASRT